MSMAKGTNVPLTARSVRIAVDRAAGPGLPDVAVSALLLGPRRAEPAVPGGDFVRHDQPADACGAVRHEGGRPEPAGATDTLTVQLDRLDAERPDIDKVLIVAAAYGGTFGQLPEVRLRIVDTVGGAESARFTHQGATVERALVLGELYRRGGAWKFRAVGQGYADGLAALAADHGTALPDPGPAPTAAPGPSTAAPAASSAAPQAPAPPASAPTAPVRLTKVTLTKEAPTVSLAKQGGTSGTMRINLNWRAPAPRQPTGWARLFGRSDTAGADLDLDLCALYELTDGRKGAIQALGDSFGDADRPPYIHLDGDDRTGAVETGENLTINLDHAARLRRVLVFVTIYEGARSFAGVGGTVTLQPQHGAPVEFSLDECTVPSTVCALALITHRNGELVVQREARYLVPERGVSPQRTVDAAYGWGMRWTPGRK